jgi:hypothetical protein
MRSAAAAAATPYFQPVNSRWMARAPLTYFKTLQRKLTDAEFRVLGVILADTIGATKPIEWARASHAYFAYWTNLSESMAGRAVGMLTRKRLIESRHAGQGREYRPAVENFAGPQEDHPPRMLRKPPQIDTLSRSVHEPRNYTPTESVQGGNLGEAIPISDSSVIEECQHDTETILALQCELPHNVVTGDFDGTGGQPLSASGDGSASFKPPPPRRDTLEAHLLRTITPKLGTCPPPAILDRAIKTLGKAPLEPLLGRITQRAPACTGWGLIPRLAADVRDTYASIKRLMPDFDEARERNRYNLDHHWASSREVRRMHSDASTPDAVRKEILTMWPELAIERKQKDRASRDKFFQEMHERDRIKREKEKH